MNVQIVHCPMCSLENPFPDFRSSDAQHILAILEYNTEGSVRLPIRFSKSFT